MQRNNFFNGNIDAQDKKGNTALHRAVLAGDFDRVNKLIKCGANLKIINNQGQTPLHAAVSGIKLSLLDHQDYQGNTALHKAIKAGHFDIAQLLLEKGADSTIENDEGLTPLALAEQLGHKEVVEYIKQQEATTAPKPF